MKPKCTCGHPESDHAGDETHRTTEPCWAGAVSGDSCECRQYEPKRDQ
jgi:hypothetical protein